tara:strand:- start:3754 stop:5124 length:1371 start_codon:yes stop_codon:yes gene_type:complete
MLNLLGLFERGRSHCDGVSRRNFLKVGGMAAGGLSLGQLLNLEAKQGIGSSNKAVINIFLPGGPSHLDTFDLKPDSPKEVRGEFNPISTNVPGMQICEHFPRLAKLADKFSIIRSICDSEGAHSSYQCMTGRTRKDANNAPVGGWPNWGSWISKVEGSRRGMPANVSLVYPTGAGWSKTGDGGFIGPAHAPMQLVEKDPNKRVSNMTLEGISLDRLNDREGLRSSLDNFRRDADAKAEMESLDSYNEQALEILADSGLVDALDLSKEDPKVVERYGVNDPTYQRDGAPKMIRNFCVARRLVEAGARVVSLNYSRWDWHGGDGMNFPRSRQEFPLLDQGLSSLITDLHERGLDKDVAVVMWGEFGRTPKLNKNNSRDHWPQTSFALLAGGGMRHGQVIGATDKQGGGIVDRPVRFQEVFSTLYHCLGVDPRSHTVTDVAGRPHYLVDPDVNPLRELI